jgi:Lar family restriction alleviation protein
MTSEELYQVYASWTGRLHHWLGQLGRHVDCEYFPETYEFRIYSGRAEIDISQSGLVGLVRPHSERFSTITLPKPQDHPTQYDLDQAFRQICFAAARVLEIDLGKLQLVGDEIMPSAPAPPEDDIKDHEGCPFCGNQSYRTYYTEEGLYVILCATCGARGPTEESVEEAWEGWDDRED